MVQNKGTIRKIIKEFKEFIQRGNVIDLAVAVIIGSAFTNIVNSLVNDIIMPLIGIIIGGIDFTNLYLKIFDVTINYGNFLQAVVKFFIIAVVIFLIVKFINKFKRQPKVEDKPSVKLEEVKLLEEIRDLLKK